MKIPELLAPAGNFEKLVTAIHYGANAVYCGGKHYSLRAHATNFSETELEKAIGYAHERSVKVYVTVNVMAHEKDLADMDDYLLHLSKIKADGIIVSDPGILMRARKLTPHMPVHLSTQANVTNAASALFWQKQGVTRINVARELSLEEISAVKKALTNEAEAAGIQDTEVEVFVHGALCISYSGRCLLSYYLTGRDANQGDCAHPCRYKYTLVEEKRPGHYFPVEEDDRGTYIFNSKDLCLLDRLPALIGAGVDSIKIEGRMKGVYYVGGVVRVYRAALDYIAASSMDKDIGMPPEFMEELTKTGTRGVTENFISGLPNAPGSDDMLYDSPRAVHEYEPAGVVKHSGFEPDLEIEVRNTLLKGTRVEYLGKGLDVFPVEIKEMINKEGKALEQANPGDRVVIKTFPSETSCPESGWEENALLRKKSGNSHSR